MRLSPFNAIVTDFLRGILSGCGVGDDGPAADNVRIRVTNETDDTVVVYYVKNMKPALMTLTCDSIAWRWRRERARAFGFNHHFLTAISQDHVRGILKHYDLDFGLINWRTEHIRIKIMTLFLTKWVPATL